jgi:predicted small secreted protein
VLKSPPIANLQNVMRYFAYILLLLFSSFLLTSCEGVVQGNGKIISSVDGKPIDNVSIIWINLSDTSYSDKNGYFEVGSFVGCVPDCPGLEVTFSKPGYESKYVNFIKEYNYSTDSLTISMTPSANDLQLKKGFFSLPIQLLKIFLSLFNLFTLIYIFLTKPQYKWFWIIGIVMFSMTIDYNYFDHSFQYNLFSFMVQFMDRFGWYTYFVPTTALLFWTNYFMNKRQRINSA